MILPRLAALLSLVLLFLALWGVVPPPTYALLVLSVGAPEVGLWLIAMSVVVLLLSRAGPSGWLRRATLVAALGVIGLSLIPLVRFDPTRRRFDAAMEAGLGPDYLRSVPGPIRQQFRPASLDLRELLTGFGTAATRVTRGVAVGSTGEGPLRADIFRPAVPGRYPMVVQVYGGAWQRGAPEDDADIARYLAARSYVVVAIDYRHAPQWQWPTQLTDVRQALAWLREHGTEFDGDPTRLALIGRSSGAQLALVAAFTDTLPVRAVVSYYGPVDLVDGYHHPPIPDPLHVQSLEAAYLGGTPDEVAERYVAASPITYADRKQPPTLLIYAGRDNVVLPRFGRLLHGRLAAAGTTSVLLEIPWAQHAFDKVPAGPSSQLALIEVERFLGWALYGGKGSEE